MALLEHHRATVSTDFTRRPCARAGRNGHRADVPISNIQTSRVDAMHARPAMDAGALLATSGIYLGLGIGGKNPAG